MKGGINLLIESLIRLGKPMVEGGISSQAILRQVSDVGVNSASGFLSRVFVVEIDKKGNKTGIAALPVQQWGEYRSQGSKSKKQVFEQDVSRAVGAPFVIPSGNPLKPQGRYGVPSYLVYDKHFQQFIKGPEEVEKFLSGRLSRTIRISLTDQEIKETASQLHGVFRKIKKDSKEKLLGLVVLAVLEEGGPYQLSDTAPVGDASLAYLGPSMLRKGKYLVAKLDLIKERFWEAKLAEGAEMGEREGEGAICYFCGEEGRVVSTYCKAWTWFTTTWNCPLPVTLKPKELVETIAVCPGCYGALTYGANLFNKLTKPLDNWLTKELFSPSSTAAGKELSRRGNAPDKIYGCAYVLPVLDNFLDDEEDRFDFVDGMTHMLEEKPRGNKIKIHLQEVTGFESSLPEEISADDYRMTIIYYSGDSSRGDIHLRATIEDVLPSVARELKKIVVDIGEFAVDLAAALYAEVSDKYSVFLRSRYSSLPYLITTAYGAPYTWKVLSAVFHRGDISRRWFLSNAACRMSELARGLPDNYPELCGEVIFYLSFGEFLRRYNDVVALKAGNRRCKMMRDWRELQSFVREGPINELCFKDPEELGFAAGHLIRVFARQYWHASNGKDFLKHRVMTFGSNLTPDSIWKRALSRVDEYARKLDMHISDDLRQRFAVVLMEYSRLKDEVARERDAFMAAFWAGYALAGAGKDSDGDNSDTN